MTYAIDAIDLHAHLNHGAVFDRPVNELHRADAEFIRQAYLHTGIACGVFTTCAAVLSTEYILEENAFMFEYSQRNDWCYQWVVVDPRQQETLLQAEELLKTDKCLGIKIHPKLHEYALPDYIDELFGFANERKTVILMHPTPQEHYPSVIEGADRYPDMKLIIAHLSDLAHIHAIRDARNRNIYTDTSGQAMRFNNILEYAIEQVGSSHIFFGTDTFSCAFERGRVEYASISDEDKSNILRDNALRIFAQIRRDFGSEEL